jgi:hypothetical protein
MNPKSTIFTKRNNASPWSSLWSSHQGIPRIIWCTEVLQCSSQTQHLRICTPHIWPNQEPYGLWDYKLMSIMRRSCTSSHESAFYRWMERGFHPVVRSIWVPLQDPRAIATLSLAFFISFTNNVSGDIPCVLSVHDFPTVGPVGPLARGSAPRDHQTDTSLKHQYVSWSRRLVLSHFIPPPCTVVNHHE